MPYIAAAGVLNFYREPGRMSQARQACQPGSTFTWDGRFKLTLSSDLSGNLSVAPPGRRWLGNLPQCVEETGENRAGQPARRARHTSALAGLAAPLCPSPGGHPCGAGWRPRGAAPDATRAAPELFSQINLNLKGNPAWQSLARTLCFNQLAHFNPSFGSGKARLTICSAFTLCT